MKYTFFQPEKEDFIEYQGVIDKFREDFDALCNGDADKTDVYEFVYEIIKNAKTLKHNPEMVFWGFGEPEQWPSDCRVDYIYIPTYIATAFLIKSLQLYPQLFDVTSRELMKINRSFYSLDIFISGAMLTCTGRGFSGHGYDDISGKLDALEIFIKGDVLGFVDRFPKLCPEFTELLKTTICKLRNEAHNGGLSNPWGTNYSDRTLKLFKDIPLMFTV